MGLEKSVFNLKNHLAKIIVPLSLTTLLSSCPVIKSEPPKNPYEYKTTVDVIYSEKIGAVGGIIKLFDSTSFITKLTIPTKALTSDTVISVGIVNNPPALPSGLNYVGTPLDFEPDGINFNVPLILQIPYSDESLSDAGLSDDSNLKLYSYNKSVSNWEEINITSIDTNQNLITAELNHFSYYAITGFNCPIPEYLGNPQPGDLLYSLGAFWDPGNSQFKDNWMPGHVGIYVGEKVDSEGNKYNVIEAQGDMDTLGGEVQRNYFNPISNFSGLNSFAGAREPKDFVLTKQQRKDIVDYVEAQVGKPYAMGPMVRSVFGMASGKIVKGPNSFNCVGLAEKAYEVAGVDNDEGLINWIHEIYLLTPTEQYRATKPAIGFQPTELKTDDGTCENGYSWAGSSDSVCGNVSNNKFGLYVLLTPPEYPFNLAKVKFYFRYKHSDEKNFYLHVWDEQHRDLLPSIPIESNEVNTKSWWEKDLSEYGVVINSGNIKVGFCESYLPCGNDSLGYPKTGWDIGVDKNNTGNCYTLYSNYPQGVYDKWAGGNLMIRAEGY